HDAGTGDDRAGQVVVGAGDSLSGRLHPPLAARGHPPATNTPRRGARGRRVEDRVKLGIIAGNGRFPVLVLAAACAQKHDVTIVAIKEETFPELNDAAKRQGAAIHWISLGQLGRCIAVLKEAGASKAVMAGQVKHTKIFAGVVPDRTFLGVLMSLTTKSTDGLIGAVARVMKDHGIDLIDSTTLLSPLLARSGVLTRREPNAGAQT